jgi:osmotically-inducible protein OsmY
MTDEPEYVEHRLIKAFAQDPDLGELEVEVTVEGLVIHLTGKVATESHRRRMRELTQEQFPGYEIVDDTEAVEMPPPPSDGENR